MLVVFKIGAWLCNVLTAQEDQLKPRIHLVYGIAPKYYISHMRRFKNKILHTVAKTTIIQQLNFRVRILHRPFFFLLVYNNNILYSGKSAAAFSDYRAEIKIIRLDTWYDCQKITNSYQLHKYKIVIYEVSFHNPVRRNRGHKSRFKHRGNETQTSISHKQQRKQQ